MKKINILMSTDDNYAMHLGVTLLSLLENTAYKPNIAIKVIANSVSDEKKELLRQTIIPYGASIEFVDFSLPNISEFKIDGHISSAAYFRLFLIDFYPADTERIIYMDCDVIVNSDIYGLWVTDLNGKVIAAIKEYESPRGEEMKLKGHYFNSGVMVIDFQKWKHENVLEKAMAYLKENFNSIVYHDQDLLNWVLDQKWQRFDDSWNYTRLHVEINMPWKNKNYKNELPHIVHYTNNTKPWHYYSRNPYDYLYFKYLELSPWKGFKPYGKTFKRIVTKKIKIFLRNAGLKNTL